MMYPPPPRPDGRTPEEIAMTILNDLLSENPTYDYDLLQTGQYERQLAILVKARKNGLQAAQLALNAIKARPDSELATLLREYKEANRVEVEPDQIPALPEHARLPEGFLPRLPDNGQDWYESWDDTALKQISPFLADYIHYSYQSSPEGYIDFHISSALWALSTIAGRRVYVDLSSPVYTPLSIALVARTSLFAKSVTANVATQVIKGAGLGWLLGDDETTPQKLLSDMSGRVPTNYAEMEEERKEKVRQRIAMSGQIGWYYDEFNQLIEAMMRPGPMAEFAGLLRKLDNCPDEYKYSTRAHGQEVIEKPYLALLASTTPANLRKHASKGGDFWSDGFWARFAFITPPPNSFKTKTMSVGRPPTPTKLTSALQRWSIRLGVPDCTIEEIENEHGKGIGRYKAVGADLPETKVNINNDAYAAYKTYRESLRELFSTGSNEDLDGSYARLSDKALRIAALLASLENKNVIDLPIWTLAQEIAEMFRHNLHEFYAQVNVSQAEESPLQEALIEFLKLPRWETATIRDIQTYGKGLLQKMKSRDLRDTLQMLEKSGIVECKREKKKEMYSLCK